MQASPYLAEGSARYGEKCEMTQPHTADTLAKKGTLLRRLILVADFRRLFYENY